MKDYNYQQEVERPVPETGPSTAVKNAPEYHFDGFTVVINEKIALTPIQRNKKKKNG